MTVHREPDGMLVVECDNCGGRSHTEKIDFKEAMYIYRERFHGKAIKSKKLLERWGHFCSECSLDARINF